ncbi:antiviral reverse transcriptase Drt3a [Chromohalobacter sp. HP20-39]|uniref:antiviral reverse transcriptase Drt3a n=1 Tax=Chromohalobacter sp. HP20-39 TaxID=3079306 RepID=UPI00294B352F|nr:antiviral reverse transcriptase Drt3a [Chromohalobacter sp. HP20-39]MDV6319466.1 antiviral reverse transcriptase Drt3a [Chromohalobacter sp. HP20-39]
MTRIQAFNESTLARHFTKEDFYNDEFLLDDEYRRGVVEKAVQQADALFPDGVLYNSFQIGKKKSFSIWDLSQKLVFRTCASHLRKSFRQQNKSRSQIAREIRVFLLDGTPYNIYRLDIKSFFESIDGKELKSCVGNLKGLSMHTRNILDKKMRFFRGEEEVSVPRGVETSAVLSEIYLTNFDRYVLSRREVFFYSRFVDDLLIITSSSVDEKGFVDELKNALPKGLLFNHEKEEVIKVGKRKKAGSLHNDKIVGVFDYLGFRFSILDSVLPLVKNGDQEEENSREATSSFRVVNVDISPRKVKRIKEKLCKAFFSFGKTGDYSLLKDRVRFLTTNRNFVKKDKSTVIPVGIYYNSSACDFPSKQLSHLDDFLRHLAFGSSSRLSKVYSSKLNNERRKEIVQFSFSYGFENRVHKRFSFNRLSKIVEVWR